MDQEQIDVSQLTEDFIEDGIKEGILVYITSVLLMNDVEREAIEKMVSRLVNYQDIPHPKIALHWRLKGVEAENKKRRKELLQKVLDEAQSEVLVYREKSIAPPAKTPSKVFPEYIYKKYESQMEA